jgi:hypothetical protein
VFSASWNEFKLDDTLDIEESDENYLYCLSYSPDLSELYVALKNTSLFHSFSPISLEEHFTGVTSVFS